MLPKTVGSLLASARTRLAAAGIGTAALDARLLLQAALGASHEEIVADPSRVASHTEQQRFLAMVARRSRLEPVSRILGEREFFGRSFLLSPSTLDPRPETELLVEEGLAQLPRDVPARILDLGTGSGAIVISLLAEREGWTGVATDLAAGALETTRRNAERHQVGERIELVQGSWFQGVRGVFDLIVSNPPYIAHGDIATLDVAVRDHDPHLALDGGPDGLESYRRIAEQAGRHLSRRGAIAVEIGQGQETEIVNIFLDRGLAPLAARKDLAGIVRVVTFRPQSP
jgi:release factor glutamine methyltransferase